MTDTTTTLILTGSGYGLEVAPEALKTKEQLLQSAGLITEVTSPQLSEAARLQIKALANMRIAVDKSRKEVKEPVLTIGRDIDAKAKEFLLELDAEEKRLSTLMGEYAALVEAERRRIAREVEAKRQAEEQARQEAEAARIKAEREAEAARIAAEKAQWEATDEAQAAKIEAAEKERQAEADRRESERKAEAARAAEAAREIAMPVAKPEGVKFVPDFEVEDIEVLYKAHPGLVTLEVKRSEVIAHIKRLTDGDTLPTIPGLRIFNKAKVSTR